MSDPYSLKSRAGLEPSTAGALEMALGAVSMPHDGSGLVVPESIGIARVRKSMPRSPLR